MKSFQEAAFRISASPEHYFIAPSDAIGLSTSSHALLQFLKN